MRPSFSRGGPGRDRGCSRGRIPTFTALALLAGLGLSAACTTLLAPRTKFELPEGLPATIVAGPAVPAVASGPSPGMKRAETGYALYLLTISIHVDFSSGKIRYLLPPKERAANTSTVWGHSWMILASPHGRVECGLTPAGKAEKSSAYWIDGVIGLAGQGHPNPVSFFWGDAPGRRHGHAPPGVRPTFVLRLPITEDQYGDIARYLSRYDFRVFNLDSHECTNLLVGALRLAGLEVEHQVKVRIPQIFPWKGNVYRLWTDEKYKEFVFSSPDLLERSLRGLAAAGIGQDFTKRY